jgi:hypothetical protein
MVIESEDRREMCFPLGWQNLALLHRTERHAGYGAELKFLHQA